MAYPIANGKLINMAAPVVRPDQFGTKHDGPMTGECSPQKLLKEFEGWEDDVQALLQVRCLLVYTESDTHSFDQCVDKALFWVVNELKGLPISTFERVALVGDAVCMLLLKSIMRLTGFARLTLCHRLKDRVPARLSKTAMSSVPFCLIPSQRERLSPPR